MDLKMKSFQSFLNKNGTELFPYAWELNGVSENGISLVELKDGDEVHLLKSTKGILINVVTGGVTVKIT